MKHIHILGVCGTFMAGLAKIAKEKGFHVTGQDENVYPPMSTLLGDMGIDIKMGYDIESLPQSADMIIIGNAMKRGMAVIEHILNERLPFCSGPKWLSDEVLSHKKVIAISGTHGKTTTSSMVAWILEEAGLNPSFLVGGLLPNFNCSARLTDSKWFVIEADEYDTAFFDKRSKFVHYHPDILSINNLEFDHADIFKNIDDILFQFHCLLRTLPQKGVLIRPANSPVIDELVAMGFWSQLEKFNDETAWHVKVLEDDGSLFDVYCGEEKITTVSWDLIGEHNMENALVAQAICQQLNINSNDIERAWHSFRPVKRRLEVLARKNNITLYDDFAHHPTAIKKTLEGLRLKFKHESIIAIIDFASHTMRTGLHKDKIMKSLDSADQVIFMNVPFNISPQHSNIHFVSNVDGVIDKLSLEMSPAHIVMMSNRGVEKLGRAIVKHLHLSD